MIVTLHKREALVSERFTVRWVHLSGGKFNILTRGYAVFDGNERITVPYADRVEAERHRDNIMAIFARYGW